ncbi:MAG TPA: hypothetical protein VFM69_09595 [Pricia sp.]|nr:hypothetical protein [Pricia sp.]
MKIAIKFYGWPVVLILLTGFSVHGNLIMTPTTIENNVWTSPETMKDNLVGGWSYTVEGAPQGYEKGLLMIIRDGDGYKVQIQVGGGTLLGEDVKVKGNTIDFEVMVEGGRVSVNLTAKGETISGKSTSSEGSYNIEGTKTLSMG